MRRISAVLALLVVVVALPSGASGRAGRTAAFGTVDVVNLFPEQAQLSVNGLVVGTLPAGNPSSGSLPIGVRVPRTQISPGPPGLFGFGPQYIEIDTQDFGIYSGAISIPRPPNPTLEQDLMLIVLYQQVVLVNEGSGQEIPQAGALGALRRNGTTRRADTLIGTKSDDVLDGGPGNDTIRAEAGNDVILGGTGSDRILAGPGNDLVYARDHGHDTVACGGGKDVVFADRGDRVSRDCETVHR